MKTREEVSNYAAPDRVASLNPGELAIAPSIEVPSRVRRNKDSVRPGAFPTWGAALLRRKKAKRKKLLFSGILVSCIIMQSIFFFMYYENTINKTLNNNNAAEAIMVLPSREISLKLASLNGVRKEKKGEMESLRNVAETQQKELLRKDAEIALRKQKLSQKDTRRASISSSTTKSDDSDTSGSSDDKTGIALDENGDLGYVPPSMKVIDSNYNKNNTNPSSYDEVCNGILPEVAEGVGGNEVLRKIKISNSSVTTTKSDSRSVRILCMVYTHSNSRENLNVILNTWASRCDGFFAASNITDQNSHSVNLLHNGPESYQNMWQKVRSMWKYAYLHYRNEYDYFHICGDDTYVMVNNLRTYLEGDIIAGILNGTKRPIYSKMQERVFYYGLDEKRIPDRYMKAMPIWKGDIQAFRQTSLSEKRKNRGENNDFMVLNYTNIPERPLVIGMAQDRNGEPSKKGKAVYYQTFPAGGCGYTFNRAALDLFVEECIPNFHPTYEDSREDVLVGACMAKRGIHTIDTRDNEGRYLYLPMNAQEHYDFDGSMGTWLAAQLQTKHKNNINAFAGMKSISPNAVAIHLKKAKIRGYAFILNMGRKRGWTEQQIKEYKVWRDSNITVPMLMYRYHALLHDLC